MTRNAPLAGADCRTEALDGPRGDQHAATAHEAIPANVSVVAATADSKDVVIVKELNPHIYGGAADMPYRDRELMASRWPRCCIHRRLL